MKKIILIGILVFVLFIFGCKQTEISTPQKVEFHKGTEGLVLTAILPVAEIDEGSEFDVGIELRNLGSYDILNGNFVIDFDPEYTEIEKDVVYFYIPGKSMEYPEGGYMIETIRARNIKVPSGKTEFEIPFTITVNYEYETEAKVDVCIGPQLPSYVKTKESACEIVQEFKVSGGQGAPLAITLIKPGMYLSGDYTNSLNAKFGVYLENEGEGEVMGDIRLKKSILGNKGIVCNKDIVKERAERGARIKRWYTSCSAVIEDFSGTFVSPLTLTFTYKYRDRIDKKLKVRAIR